MSLSVNSLVPSIKPPFMERTHYMGPSGAATHRHSHHHSKGSSKHSIALTALTLLSFLFFLNILQNCLQEHMDAMTPQQVMIMQARVKQIREIEAQNRKGDSNSEIVNTSTNEEKMAQIPVKLKTNEKATKPY